MKTYLILSYSLVLLAACKDQKTIEPEAVPTTNCIEHLKSHSFETYKIDSQSFNMTTDKPASAKGSFVVDTLSERYVIETFNATADSATNTQDGWTRPALPFKIVGHSMFFGDDEMPFSNCSETGFEGTTLEEGAAPNTYTKFKVYFRLKK